MYVKKIHHVSVAQSKPEAQDFNNFEFYPPSMLLHKLKIFSERRSPDPSFEQPLKPFTQ